MDAVVFDKVSKLDFNQVSKYHSTLLAANDITKADLVGILDSKVRKYGYLVSESPQSWTPLYMNQHVTLIGDNKFVCIGGSRLKLFSYDPVSYEITYLNQTTIEGSSLGTNGKCDVAYLSDDTVAVLSLYSTSTGRLNAVKINGDNTFTIGTAYDLSDQLGMEYMSLIYLGGRKLFAVGVSSGSSYYMVPTVIEYDATFTTATFTAGSYTGVAHYAKAARLADDKVLLTFSDGDNSSRLTFVIGTITGTTIAFGSEFYVTSRADAYRTLFVWDTNKVLIGNKTSIVSLVCDTVNNTVSIAQNITLASLFPTSFATAYVSSFAKIDSSTLLMAVNASINSTLAIYLVTLSISNNTVSVKRNVPPMRAGSNIGLAGDTNVEITQIGSTDKYIICSGKPCIVSPIPESDWFIALNDALVDEDIAVQFEGVVSAFTNLDIGTNYYAHLDVGLISSSPVALGYSTPVYIGTAISNTSIKLSKSFGGDML